MHRSSRTRRESCHTQFGVDSMIHTAEIESSNLASPFVYDDEAQVLTVTFKGNGKR